MTIMVRNGPGWNQKWEASSGVSHVGAEVQGFGPYFAALFGNYQGSWIWSKAIKAQTFKHNTSSILSTHIGNAPIRIRILHLKKKGKKKPHYNRRISLLQSLPSTWLYSGQKPNAASWTKYLSSQVAAFLQSRRTVVVWSQPTCSGWCVGQRRELKDKGELAFLSSSEVIREWY